VAIIRIHDAKYILGVPKKPIKPKNPKIATALLKARRAISFLKFFVAASAGVTDFEQVLQKSLEAAKARKPMFEAGFVHSGGFARVDILNPAANDAWDIIEVKSATEVKNVNLIDLAFQAFVYNGAGLKIRRCCVMHVNRDYVRRGPVAQWKNHLQTSLAQQQITFP